MVPHNLLLWKWSNDFDTPAKRKKANLKFRDITTAFVATGKHPAIGEVDLLGFCAAVDAAFGSDESKRPFVLKHHPKCTVVVRYAEEERLDLVPRIAAIGRRFDLNAAEF